ncbi:endonuclease/exonuclease/phosphatase family protein [Stigmatella erecta]|uniref:Metal-dependent hydrolase, endonuclease/exonuclease/phosphatase family n=1 Tax=Stigmatella erecta TaxID=83460 RepID=A0A1I0JZM8_9BACT|nr:endonuclease/exonuclease/phosphatase family protein [Stigmatella erecta]SEU15940.1 Metal-dependent hydrolase, endonuclease/exonuclease/phosphatase family [Stigmatella erecta]
MSPPIPDSSTLPGRLTYALRVVSLNIWNPGPDKVQRNQGLAAVLRERNLDVVLLQEMEGSKAQFERFQKGSGLPYGVWAGDVAILSRFELTDFEAPELPRKPSLTPIRQLLNRRDVYFCMAAFQHHGTRFHVSSHHWDNRQLINRKTAAAATAGRLSRVPSASVILCGGDFNTHQDTAELQRVMAEGLHNSGEPGDFIDFILYRGPHLQVLKHTLERFPGLTDHPMLLTEFVLNGSRPAVA